MAYDDLFVLNSEPSQESYLLFYKLNNSLKSVDKNLYKDTKDFQEIFKRWSPKIVSTTFGESLKNVDRSVLQYIGVKNCEFLWLLKYPEMLQSVTLSSKIPYINYKIAQ